MSTASVSHLPDPSSLERLPEKPAPWYRRITTLLPGIVLLLAVGYAGRFIEQVIAQYGKAHHLTLPNIEYVLWSILLGLLIANTVGVPTLFKPGVATYDFWLKVGIVLLGSKFLLKDILRLGSLSLMLVAIEIVLALSLMHLLGRIFKLGLKLTTLLAVGSSICGVSAIIATQGAIDADEEDSSYAIAAILALGAISLFTFPLIGHWLHLSEHAYGLWAGLAVDNTAEATAAGALFSPEAGKMAVLAKTTRNAMIGFVVLAYAIYWTSKGEGQVIGNKAVFLWKKFPKFVLGFLLVSLIGSFGLLNKTQLTDVANVSRWAFMLTFAGVGLRTNLKELTRQGWKPLLVGTIGEVVIAFLTLGLIFGADHLVHL